MGQRLVVSFRKDGKTVINTYFHWSAYTDSAIEITLDLIDTLNEGVPSDIPSLIDVFKQIKNYNPCILIHGIKSERTLSSILSKEDVDYLTISKEEKNLLLDLLDNRYILHVEKSGEEGYYDIFEKGANRNDGLISIFKKDIEESWSWFEGDVFIDLDEKTIDFEVYGYWGGFEDFENDYMYFSKEVPESERTIENYFNNKFIDLSSCDLHNLSFEDFYKFSILLLHSDYGLLDKNNNIIIHKI